MSFDIVVAADLDWGIGKDQTLPWPKLRGDLRHFRKITSTPVTPGRRNAIVMGRKTWQSKEVAERPLPERLNVVVSRGPLEVPTGVVLARSLDEAFAVQRTHDVESIFVVGGAGLLVDAIEHPELRYVYLTRIDGRYDCEIRMPDLDARGFARTDWEGEQQGDEHGVRYRIERLRR